MKEEKEVPRGTKVTSYNDKIDKDNTNYTKICPGKYRHFGGNNAIYSLPDCTICGKIRLI